MNDLKATVGGLGDTTENRDWLTVWQRIFQIGRKVEPYQAEPPMLGRIESARHGSAPSALRSDAIELQRAGDQSNSVRHERRRFRWDAPVLIADRQMHHGV